MGREAAALLFMLRCRLPHRRVSAIRRGGDERAGGALMIRWLAVPALVVVMTLPALVGATHSNGEGPGRDLIAGTLILDTPQLQAQFHINAKSDPDGSDPNGSFFLREEP